MKSSEILLYLLRNNITVFTTGDIARITDKPLSYAKKIITKIPGIKRAEKGVYYLERASIYEVASNIVPFSYVSALSALKFYELTTQYPIVISVMSPKKHRIVALPPYKIEFVMLKRSLIFGYVRRGNAFVAEPEKAFLDSLYLGRYSYIDEALAKGIENETISVSKLIKYAQQYKKKALLNKLGFFLERYAEVEASQIHSQISRAPVFLIGKAKNYDKKWRVYYG